MLDCICSFIFALFVLWYKVEMNHEDVISTQQLLSCNNNMLYVCQIKAEIAMVNKY